MLLQPTGVSKRSLLFKTGLQLYLSTLGTHLYTTLGVLRWDVAKHAAHHAPMGYAPMKKTIVQMSTVSKIVMYTKEKTIHLFAIYISIEFQNYFILTKCGGLQVT